jgi:hypothetical protein
MLLLDKYKRFDLHRDLISYEITFYDAIYTDKKLCI